MTRHSLPKSEVAISKGNITPRYFCLTRCRAGLGHIGTPPQLKKTGVLRRRIQADSSRRRRKLVGYCAFWLPRDPYSGDASRIHQRFRKFMQILARQNYANVGTQIVLAKDQLGKGRDMQR